MGVSEGKKQRDCDGEEIIKKFKKPSLSWTQYSSNRKANPNARENKWKKCHTLSNPGKISEL